MNENDINTNQNNSEYNTKENYNVNTEDIIQDNHANFNNKENKAVFESNNIGNNNIAIQESNNKEIDDDNKSESYEVIQGKKIVIFVNIMSLK